MRVQSNQEEIFYIIISSGLRTIYYLYLCDRPRLKLKLFSVIPNQFKSLNFIVFAGSIEVKQIITRDLHKFYVNNKVKAIINEKKMNIWVHPNDSVDYFQHFNDNQHNYMI